MADDEVVSLLRVQASDETAGVMRDISRRVQDLAGAFSKLTLGAGIEEAARRAFTSFAQVERNMERMQFSTRATDQQMRGLQRTFEEVSRTTGQSIQSLQQSFTRFYDSTSQPLEAATEQFKTIAGLSEATGASMDDLGRAAAAAINNLKVPQQEVGDLLRKWAVEVPASMLGSFAQVAPRLTQELETLGFTGQKAGEQVAQVFVEIARATGSPRQAMMEINQMLSQLGNASTRIGQMMFPIIQQVKAEHGSIVDMLVAVDKQLEGFRGLPPEMLPKILGVDYNFLKALETIRQHLPEINQRIKEGVDPMKALGDVMGKTGHDGVAALNQLSASFDELRLSFGQAMSAIGANQVLQGLAASLRDAAQFAGVLSNALKAIVPGTPIQEQGKAAVSAGSGLGNLIGRQIENIAKSLPGYNRLPGAPDTLFPRPHMARGGIVRATPGGTNIVAGEAGQDEAIVPLTARGSQAGDDERDNTKATRELTEQVKRLVDQLDPSKPKPGGYGGGGGMPHFTTGDVSSAVSGGASSGGGSSGGAGGGFSLPGMGGMGGIRIPGMGRGLGSIPPMGGGAGGGAPGVSGAPSPEGQQTDGAAAAQGQSSGGVPGHVLETAKQVALHGGPGAVQQFMSSQGYPKAGNWCGEFAASVMHANGMAVPKNPAIASNWRNTPGYHEVATPGPGDIAVRRGPPTGSTGSHVTFVDQGNAQTFTGVGGNQGHPESTFRTSQYQFYAPNEAIASGAPTGGSGSAEGLDRGAYEQMFRGTPLAGHYDDVVKSAKENGVSPALMAGVMAHETGRGKSAMLRDRNNPAGLMDPATGMAQGQRFSSVSEGIAAAGRSIGKNYRRGGQSIEGMGRIYAPVGAANDPRHLNSGWAAGVSKYAQQLRGVGSEHQEAAMPPAHTPSDRAASATLEQHRRMREEMEKPIRANIEAPTAPPQLGPYRRRMARAEGRWQNEAHSRDVRYNSGLDVGIA